MRAMFKSIHNHPININNSLLFITSDLRLNPGITESKSYVSLKLAGVDGFEPPLVVLETT